MQVSTEAHVTALSLCSLRSIDPDLFLEHLSGKTDALFLCIFNLLYIWHLRHNTCQCKSRVSVEMYAKTQKRHASTEYSS